MKQFLKKLRRQILLYLPAWHGQAVAKDLADFLRKPLANFDKLSKKALARHRQTQVKKLDHHFDLLKKKGEYYLARLKDQTLGWVHHSQIEKISREEMASRAKELYVKARIDLDLFMQNYVDSPYLFGGNTEQGIDCSALMQRLYSQVYHIQLPKHSKDQAKFGKEIKNLDSMRQGDLVFFSKLDTHTISHVAMVIDAEQKMLFHAAENVHNKVVKELLDEMMKRYKIVEVRRILLDKKP